MSLLRLMFLFLIASFTTTLPAQVLQGTLNKDLSVSNNDLQNKVLSQGTKVDVIHFKNDKVRIRHSGGFFNLIDRDDIQIDKIPDDFISQLWYYELASRRWRVTPAKANLRIQLFKVTANFVNHLEEEQGFMDNLFVVDYLYRVLAKVIPQGLPRSSYTKLEIKVLKESRPYQYTADQGLIILSTGLIGLCRSEEELQMLLAKGGLQILLKTQNYFVFNSFSGTSENLSPMRESVQASEILYNNLHMIHSYAAKEWVSRFQAGAFNFYSTKNVPDNPRVSRRIDTAQTTLLRRYAQQANFENEWAYFDGMQRLVDYFEGIDLSEEFATQGNFPWRQYNLFNNINSKDYQTRYDANFDWMIVDLLAENASLEFDEKHYFYAQAFLDRV